MDGHLSEKWIWIVQVNLNLTLMNVIRINTNEHNEIFYVIDVSWLS